MSGIALDVMLQPRLGPRVSARRQRVTAGSDVVVWLDVRNEATAALIPGATGIAAVYWLPGTRGNESAAQPLAPVETSPGTWQVVVPETLPGSYVVWWVALGRTAEIVFDVASSGDLTLTSTGTVPWGDVQAVAAAAGVSAALPEARRVAVEVGAQAGADAAQPFAESAAASEIVALDAADLARDSELAAASARVLAEAARSTAEQAAATSSANAAGSAITVLTKAELDALTSIPGTSPAQPLRALLLATVVAEGKNYRRNAANTAWTVESDALPAVEARTAGLERQVSTGPGVGSTILTDGARSVIAEIGLDRLLLEFLSMLAGDRPLSIGDGSGAILLDVEQDGTVSTPGFRLRADGVLETPFGQIDASGLVAGNLLLRAVASGNGLAITDGAGTVTLQADGTVLESTAPNLDMAGWSLRKREDDSGGLLLMDPAGTVVVEITPAGIVAGATAVGEARAAFAGLSYEPATVPGIRMARVDPAGGVIWAEMEAGGFELQETAPTGRWTTSEIATRDAAQREAVSEQQRQVVAGIALCTAAINAIVSQGQSNSNGTQSGPLLTRAPRMPADLLMLGLSVRPASSSTASAAPMQDSTLRPLVATMRGTGSQGNGLLTLAEADQVAYDSPAEGETILEGALHQFRRGQLAALGLDSDPNRVLVAQALGVGGTLISEHQQGGAVFSRYLDGATRLKAAADALGRPAVIGAVHFDQGQWDDSQTAGTFAGGTPLPDRVGYGNALKALITDYRQRAGVEIMGQRLPPAFYLHQTRAASSAAQAYDMGVQMGQIDAATDLPGVFLVGPAYAVPDRITHYGAQGFRFAGVQAGKVQHWTQVLRRPWPILMPTRLERRGREILLSYPVLHPPLVFDRPWGNAGYAADRPDKGFRALDANRADLGIAGVEIVGATQVLVTLMALPATPTMSLRFADHSVGGNGFLRDSDPTRSEEVWDYLAGTTQGAAENIPALIGKPYPLWNWGAGFHLTVTSV